MKKLIAQEHVSPIREFEMCEFNVILDGEKIYEDVVYAKDEEKSIKVKTILGETREFQNCKIIEVDVNNAKLVLKKAQ
ncbi:MAG: CooT family nickel-binding protein [Candidatus Bathyarchaeota archaeon]|nr:CooT family nickel-binding protein [Candidatus Bathyarchaeota archaeon]